MRSVELVNASPTTNSIRIATKNAHRLWERGGGGGGEGVRVCAATPRIVGRF